MKKWPACQHWSQHYFKLNIKIIFPQKNLTGWWFGTCFTFPNSWDDDPIWLSYFFRGRAQPPTRIDIPIIFPSYSHGFRCETASWSWIDACASFTNLHWNCRLLLWITMNLMIIMMMMIIIIIIYCHYCYYYYYFYYYYDYILLYTIIYYYILLHTIIICLLTLFLLRIPCFSHFLIIVWLLPREAGLRLIGAPREWEP